MNKEQFLAELGRRLSGLPRADLTERLSFYSEMIDDRVEEGLTEEAAVAEIGPVDQIVQQIIEETPISRLVLEKVKPKRRMRAWEIVLLILGFPLWFPLLVSAFAVLFSVFVVIWAVVLSLWAVEAAMIVSAVVIAARGIVNLFGGERAEGLLHISAGLVLAGLSIFLYFGCVALTRGTAGLTKASAGRIKALFLRKENAE